MPDAEMNCMLGVVAFPIGSLGLRLGPDAGCPMGRRPGADRKWSLNEGCQQSPTVRRIQLRVPWRDLSGIRERILVQQRGDL